ncbi:hypothetical protein Q7C36_000572 [Tachysurus vachellii]|uniref:Ty3 transposon capsid-like protein domain-containing protein n=1 Tax=Tachysurus vachellii TaxID=175792 RepID=A0AA88TIY4_TACVA|nr:hypothetical protein Q7C36_000572 [Tachysurus vachellii]
MIVCRLLRPSACITVSDFCFTFDIVFADSDLCLLYLELVLKSVHMDPQSHNLSLKKTSLPHDPAAASQLVSQLAHLASLTGELVTALQCLQNIPTTSSMIPATTNPWLSFPEKFDPARCRGFLMQCSLFVTQQLALYPTDTSRIALVCSLLTGRALEWATTVWREDGSAFSSFSHFLAQFRSVFDHVAGGESAEERLLNISQGSHSAAEYTQAGWEERPLKLLFREGLSHELQAELACRDEGRSLADFMDLSICLNNLIRARRSSTHSPSSECAQPTHHAFAHLTPLCLYCDATGHRLPSCPVRPHNEQSKLVSVASFTSHTQTCARFAMRLNILGGSIELEALIDSGAAGNFISEECIKANAIPVTECEVPSAVEAIDG